MYFVLLAVCALFIGSPEVKFKEPLKKFSIKFFAGIFILVFAAITIRSLTGLEFFGLVKDPAYRWALVLTLAIEMPLAALFFKDKNFIYPAVIANILTNLAANYIVQSNPCFFLTDPYAAYILKILIIAFEFLFYALFYKKIQGLALFSIAANTASYLLGIIIQK